MNLAVLGKATQKFVIENSPQILTGIGVVGTVSTAVLTGKAAYKHCRIMEDRGVARLAATPREEFQMVWKLYVPAVGTGVITVVCIIGAQHVSGSRAAGLATAYAISEKSFSEYRAKVLEKMGPKDEELVRAEIAQERVHKNSDSNLVIVSGTDVMCYDVPSDRYFTSNMETMKAAQNNLNHQLLQEGRVTAADFYEMLGLTAPGWSEQVGWTYDDLLELKFTTVLSEDQRPCIAMDFHTKPSHRFDRFL